MSFPNIPPFEPGEIPDLCQAKSLLLTSIAMEEQALARLIQAEADKLSYVLEQIQGSEEELAAAEAVNRSAEQLLRTISGLQMLLRFKLRDVMELTDCCPSCPEPCPPGGGCHCTLTGSGSGVVHNPFDRYNGGEITLLADVACAREERENPLCYTVHSGCDTLTLTAAGSCTVQCCRRRCCGDQVTVTGQGRVSITGEAEIEHCLPAAYTLTASNEGGRCLSIRMCIRAHGLCHDSGTFLARPADGVPPLCLCCRNS